MIPFNIPYLTGHEEEYIRDALQSRRHCGNYDYGRKSIELLKKKFGFLEVFLTPSCTAALEMGAILADLQPGDEVILPSYTFSSTVNAIVLRGARPVFCDVDMDTMNIPPQNIERLITPKTKMILPIDYAGIPCRIDETMELASAHNITVMIDAAQSINSWNNGKPVGTVSHLTAFSFHESKNINCGEGGALVVNKPEWIQRAQFIQEKGTDRSLVLKGFKSKYGWVDLGSSFLLSDILAAMLFSQLKQIDEITEMRGAAVAAYNDLFQHYFEMGKVKIPNPPKQVKINNHAFFVIFDTEENQKRFLALLKEKQIYPYIGYVPLHSSGMGKKYGYKPEDVPVTEDISSRIVRLPLFGELQDDMLNECIDGMKWALRKIYGQ